jgi:hypothetical protein
MYNTTGHGRTNLLDRHFYRNLDVLIHDLLVRNHDLLLTHTHTHTHMHVKTSWCMVRVRNFILQGDSGFVNHILIRLMFTHIWWKEIHNLTVCAHHQRGLEFRYDFFTLTRIFSTSIGTSLNTTRSTCISTNLFQDKTRCDAQGLNHSFECKQHKR